MAKLTANRQQEFLQWLAQGASVSAAARAIAVSRNALYLLRDRDERFRLAWDEATEQGTDRLEDEALRRAVEGYEQPVFYRGVIVGHVRRYSDGLLIELLRARRPERFQNHSRSPEGSIEPALAALFAEAMAKSVGDTV